MHQVIETGGYKGADIDGQFDSDDDGKAKPTLMQQMQSEQGMPAAATMTQETMQSAGMQSQPMMTSSPSTLMPPSADTSMNTSATPAMMVTQASVDVRMPARDRCNVS